MTAAVFKSFAPGDPGFAVRARVFVLCLGGIENPRALLNCASQIPAGIGNAARPRRPLSSASIRTTALGQVYYEEPIPEAEVRGEPRGGLRPDRGLHASSTRS